MSDIAEAIFSFGFFGGILSAILLVIFGQVTVKKLRKNPEIKNSLGIEYVSGMNIANVAVMLCLPRSWASYLDKSPAAFIGANSEAIYKNTNRFDRILGRSYFLLSIISIIALFTAMAVEHFRLFP